MPCGEVQKGGCALPTPLPLSSHLTLHVSLLPEALGIEAGLADAVCPHAPPFIFLEKQGGGGGKPGTRCHRNKLSPALLQGGEEEIGPCRSEHQDDTPLLNLSASRASPRPSSLTRYLLSDRKSPRVLLDSSWGFAPRQGVTVVWRLGTQQRMSECILESCLFTNINLQCSSSCHIPSSKSAPFPGRQSASWCSPLTPAFP